MADAHNNRVVVTLGGDEVELVASKLAERIYGDRFRHAIDELGDSNAYHVQDVPVLDDDGNLVMGEDGKTVTKKASTKIGYAGQLKFDVAVSAQTRSVGVFAIPVQVVAATWAMAKAAGSTELNYSEFLIWWDSLESNWAEEIALFEAVCVDLSERAFFRDFGRRVDAQEPDEAEGAE